MASSHWSLLVFAIFFLQTSPQSFANDDLSQQNCSLQLSAPATPENAAKSYNLLVESFQQSKDFASFEMLDSAFDQVYNHPVTNLDALDQYDPKGLIGFCFGRKEAIRLLLMQMGLKDEKIKSLFVIGDLRSEGVPEWRFHVTTLAQAVDGNWYALDPILGKVLPAHQWIQTVRDTWDQWQSPEKNDAAILYLTDGDIMIPQIQNSAPDYSRPDLHIIDLGFRPSLKEFQIDASIVPQDLRQKARYQIYTAKPDIQEKYFSGVNTHQSVAFDLNSITIHGIGEIHYNNYFVDLLNQFPKNTNPHQQIGQGLNSLTVNSSGHSSQPPVYPLRIRSRFGMTLWNRK